MTTIAIVGATGQVGAVMRELVGPRIAPLLDRLAATNGATPLRSLLPPE